MNSLIAINPFNIIIVFILLLFVCVGVVLYIKQLKIEAESRRLLKENERLFSDLALGEDDKPYEDFTSNHIY